MNGVLGRAVPPVPGGTPERRARILLAEDNRVNQVVALKILGRLGHRADLAATGLEALHALRGVRYDLVLMDVQMPEMDGLDATRLIRSGAAGVEASKIPIVAMTAHAGPGDRERFLRAGMTDYLTKPIDPAALAAVLERWGAATPRADPPASAGSEP